MLLNQAYFLCPNCDDKHHIYGPTTPFHKTAQNLGIDVLGELPIVGAVNEHGNRGVPYILDDGTKDGKLAAHHVSRWRETMDVVCDKVIALQSKGRE